jgi:hypothetical protein
MTSEIVEAATAFQADDEGSIPFTRSNVFNGLRTACSLPQCLTSWLLLRLTKSAVLFS